MSDERDREVAAAWCEASREEPPPALDAAIRAEARRAVGAAPGGRRHRQWRYPAAAAATVAVLAFGIAQMTSRERIEPMIVADQVAPPQKALPAPAASPSPVAEPVTRPATAADAKVAAAPAIPEPAIPAPATKPSSPAPPRQALRQEASAVADRFAAVPASPQRQANEQAARNVSPPGESRADLATAVTPKAQPFPPMAQQAPPATAPSDEPKASATAPANEPTGAAASVMLREQTSRDTYARTPGSAAGVASSKVKREQVAALPPPATSADELKAQQAGAQSVAAWITRIRALKDGGQLDAAARELTRFRSAFGDRADALLPADLRGVTSSDAKGQ